MRPLPLCAAVAHSGRVPITVAEIDALMQASSAAIATGDVQTALAKALAAHALLAAIPDGQNGVAEQRWDRNAIAKYIELLRKQAAVTGADGTIAGGTMNYIPLEFRRPRCREAYS